MHGDHGVFRGRTEISHRDHRVGGERSPRGAPGSQGRRKTKSSHRGHRAHRVRRGWQRASITSITAITVITQRREKSFHGVHGDHGVLGGRGRVHTEITEITEITESTESEGREHRCSSLPSLLSLPSRSSRREKRRASYSAVGSTSVEQFPGRAGKEAPLLGTRLRPASGETSRSVSAVLPDAHPRSRRMPPQHFLSGARASLQRAAWCQRERRWRLPSWGRVRRCLVRRSPLSTLPLAESGGKPGSRSVSTRSGQGKWRRSNYCMSTSKPNASGLAPASMLEVAGKQRVAE